MSVDSARVSLERLSHVRIQHLCLALRHTAESKHTQKAVGLQRERAEDLGQSSVADTPMQLHLPQAILRMYVALRHKEVGVIPRIDMGHAPTVTHDLDGRCQARHVYAARRARERQTQGGHGAEARQARGRC